eukprot:TRINITY_DN41766_c0_g1_i1.p1 TRINITY_DN41766_c0_g1~~TRINITY_DN41766_c0_g1_i1.p1  ORF type:complete len:397 (+),score=53.73 TRINITY_DN41766_c0_g1_i1:26-1216(+)
MFASFNLSYPGQHVEQTVPSSGAEGICPTPPFSNTVCISDPDGQWMAAQTEKLCEISELGQIARLDASIMPGCILVTYFDVRAAQQLIFSNPDRCETFPPAPNDARVVRVELASIADKLPNQKAGFSQFGEVANISVSLGIAIVEFYDMRAAQLLIATSDSTAEPVSPLQVEIPTVASAGYGTPWPAAAMDGLGGVAGFGKSASYEVFADAYKRFEQDDTKPELAAAKSLQRAQVSTNEFSKFDIDLVKIRCGEDVRTTVMVRNLSGQNARRDFLAFMEKCGLGDRFTFFYMPCKAHKNVPAGFAFVNFISSQDVHKLYVVVQDGTWREFMKQPSNAKPPGVSYARFQGHDELTNHFRSSAVLHEQDPDKRPIFRPDAAKVAEEKKWADGKGTHKE